MKELADLIPKIDIEPSSPEALSEYLWRKETIPRMREAGLPSRFWKRFDFSNSKPQLKVLRLAEKLCCGSGAIVALVGPRGTGKTTLAAQMIRARAENESLPPWERQPPYRKAGDLLNRFKAIYSDMGHIDMDQLQFRRDEYCKLSLHVIDEIHECEELKARDRMLTDICDRCYSAKTDMILISNQTREQFIATTNESILSRLSEHGKIIECRWPSFREEKF